MITDVYHYHFDLFFHFCTFLDYFFYFPLFTLSRIFSLFTISNHRKHTYYILNHQYLSQLKIFGVSSFIHFSSFLHYPKRTALIETVLFFNVSTTNFKRITQLITNVFFHRVLFTTVHYILAIINFFFPLYFFLYLISFFKFNDTSLDLSIILKPSNDHITLTR